MTTILGVSSADSVTPVSPYCNPVTHALRVDVAVVNTVPVLGTRLTRDENHISVGGGINISDPTKVLPIMVNPVNGRVLISF